MEKAREISRDEFLINLHNISLKAKVSAEMELAFLNKKSIIILDPKKVGDDAAKMAVDKTNLQEIINNENTYLEVIDELRKNGEDK